MSEQFNAVEWLRSDYCNCLDAYKDRGMVDPQCESCQTKSERTACADEIERLTVERDRLLGVVKRACIFQKQLEALCLVHGCTPEQLGLGELSIFERTLAEIEVSK